MEYCPETLEDRIDDRMKDRPDTETKLRSLMRDNSETTFVDDGGEGPRPHLISWSTISTGDADCLGLDVQSAAMIVRDILHGLIYIHKEGIVHRDLKPRNGTISFDIADKINNSALL